MQPRFFETPSAFRTWLEQHHADAAELLVGFYKKESGKPSITWPEAVDEALRFGWIDGVRRGLDAESYSIRFTPRRPSSTWSAVNVARVDELRRARKMRPEGLAAFERRKKDNIGTYSYEQRDAARLDKAQEGRFRANRGAWDFFQGQAPSYRKAAIWWVVSAKREATRDKRLTTLIDDSSHGRTIPPLTRRTGPTN